MGLMIDKSGKISFNNVNELVKECYPNGEYQHPIFAKFGTRTGGICDTWLLNDTWRSLPDIDKWKYVALCSLYWNKRHEQWDSDARNENAKLHQQIYKLTDEIKSLKNDLRRLKL